MDGPRDDGSGCGLTQCGREGELEFAALAGGAFGPDAATMLLNDAAAESQAEAGAAEIARVGGIALLESIKDLFEFLGRDAAAPILDAEGDKVFAGGLG